MYALALAASIAFSGISLAGSVATDDAYTKIIVSVCNAVPSPSTGVGYGCGTNCTQYTMRSGSCLADPTDSYMSMQLTCRHFAKCWSNSVYLFSTACQGTTPFNGSSPCNYCDVHPNGRENYYSCSGDTVTVLGNCTNKCASGCVTEATLKPGTCTQVPVQPHVNGSVYVSQIGNPCTEIHHVSYSGTATCNSSNARDDGWSESGTCAYFNIDNEGTFGYRFTCVATSTADVDELPPLPQALQRAIMKSRKQ